MFLLFGTTARERIITVVTFVCHFCQQAAPQNVVESATKFSLFFVPLFTISRQHFNICTNCGGTTPLSSEQANNGIEWAERSRQVQ